MARHPSSVNNKRVLLLGLGLLGGGVATAQWLLKRGAQVTVHDAKNAKELAPSIRRVEEYIKRISSDGGSYEKLQKRLHWELGNHDLSLVDQADLVVLNPAIPLSHPLVVRAIKLGIPLENEGTLFYGAWRKPSIGITGTRGKTTTVHWTSHFIDGSTIVGNSPTRPFLAVLNNAERAGAAVTELSSFALELFDHVQRGPHISVITNLFQDHQNRHRTMEEYAMAKSLIFKRHTARDHLILNAGDAWTPWFLKQGSASHIHFFSLSPLQGGEDGIWYADDSVWQRVSRKATKVLHVDGFEKAWGRHNIANLLASSLAAHCAGVSWPAIQKKIATLPQVSYRQETVFKSRAVRVINDTTATSPEGNLAALRRWGGPNCVLIVGGTDCHFDYGLWGQEVSKWITKNNLIFLAGSATLKMRAALGTYGRGIRAYDDLKSALLAAQERACKYINSVILFSPAAKSFELFANEYDRGQQFNSLVERFF